MDQETNIIAPDATEAIEAVKVQNKLYGVELRNLTNNVGRLVNVVAENAKEAIEKIASQVTREEIIWEAKFLAEVHI